MRFTLSLLVLLFVLLLSACSAAPVEPSTAPTPDTSATLSAIVSATLLAVEVEVPTATVTLDPSTTPAVVITSNNLPLEQGQTRTDEQGAVVVDVTPNNLDNPGDTIDFAVGLNTHSVDLSMDLAKLSTLKTDTGLTASSLAWNGMAGGHHVSGNLTFPAQVDGKNLLEGAKVLTLVIQNVDAPERAFTWNIEP